MVNVPNGPVCTKVTVNFRTELALAALFIPPEIQCTRLISVNTAALTPANLTIFTLQKGGLRLAPTRFHPPKLLLHSSSLHSSYKLGLETDPSCVTGLCYWTLFVKVHSPLYSTGAPACSLFTVYTSRPCLPNPGAPPTSLGPSALCLITLCFTYNQPTNPSRCASAQPTTKSYHNLDSPQSPQPYQYTTTTTEQDCVGTSGLPIGFESSVVSWTVPRATTASLFLPSFSYPSPPSPAFLCSTRLFRLFSAPCCQPVYRSICPPACLSVCLLSM